MTDTKNVLLRLDPDLADNLRAVAEVEGRSVSDVAREAIAELVDRRRRDKRFLRKLDDNVNRHAELLRALRNG
jgi:predicted transcriptional regulator